MDARTSTSIVTAQIIEEHLSQVTELHEGNHHEGEQMCAMEAVAFIAGEPWGDSPQCASPVISTFMRTWNDCLPDSERTELLLPLIPLIVNTRGSEELEQRRAMMAADWLIRVNTPAWLRVAGLDANADALESLPEITGSGQLPGLVQILDEASDAAWAAARAAAEVWATAWAAGAAWATAWAAAEAADVAWEAAWAASVDTKRKLQQSAVELVKRMAEAR